MRAIVMYPNKILRTKTAVINRVDNDLIKDINDLKEVLLFEKNHVAGLAAVQIGLNRRFFGLLMSNDKEMKIFINPKIEATFGERVTPMMVFENGEKETFLEGCLSFTGLFGVVKRYLKLEGSWDEIENGKLVRKKGIFEGVDAIAFAHEGEHLDGILFIDYIKKESRELYKYVGDKKMKWDVEKVVGEER